MKRTLLSATAILSIIFLGFYVVLFISIALDTQTDASQWGLLAMFIMLPTALLLLVGVIFNILYNVKKKNNHLLIAAISYSLAAVVVYQIFYLAIVQAAICWYYWYRTKNQTSHT